jgi:hypothetical protein
VAVFVSGCHSVSRPVAQPAPMKKSVSVPASPTFMQWLYIWKYESYRSKGLEKFGLPADATLEDFRPHIATMLGLPDIVSFPGILSHHKVKELLTEERRLRIIEVFDLPSDSTWIDICRFAEYIRIHRPHNH